MTVNLRGMGAQVTPTGIMCTMDATLCPDGSSVGRVGPNCDFAPCPTVVTAVPITPLPPITSDSNITHFQYGVDPVTGCPLAPDGPTQVNYCKWWEKISADLIEEPGGGNKYGHCRCEPNWMKIGGIAVGVFLLMGMLKR